MAAAPKKKKTSQPAKKNTRTPPPPAPTYGREIAGGVCLLLALCAVVILCRIYTKFRPAPLKLALNHRPQLLAAPRPRFFIYYNMIHQSHTFLFLL